MIPAPSAVLALLVLKLLDKERRSHIDDFNTDEALGLFAGLNILPKKSFATAYSYRAGRDQQLGLMRGWVKALAPLMFPANRVRHEICAMYWQSFRSCQNGRSTTETRWWGCAAARPASGATAGPAHP